MVVWLENLLGSEVSTAVFLLLSFLAGVFTILSAGCNYSVIGAMAGFSASRKKAKAESIIAWVAYLLAIGATLAMGGALLGAVGGFGQYGKYIAGFLVIVFGMTALGLSPFKMPKVRLPESIKTAGFVGCAVFGFLMGLVSAAMTFTCCAPLLWLVLGASVVKSSPVFGSLVTLMFALGFTLPVGAIMLGVNLGAVSSLGNKFTKPIQMTGGVILIAMGFLLLAN